MEAMDERRVWQRVRGEDRTERIRSCLMKQAELLRIYRQLSRRGGKCRTLFEQKQNQVACLKGVLRVLTGQGVHLSAAGEVPVDLMRCHAGELEFLKELTELGKDAELGPVFDTLRDRQKRQCRLLLEIIGGM